MKPALFWPLTALLGFAIVILVLNLLERDVYEHGTLAPPPPGSNVPDDDPLMERLFPREFAHPCPTCGECRHALEILQNRREMTLRDHDGWYRLFWARGETYHYDDPIYFAEGLQNPTARDPQGTWMVLARIGPAAHGPSAAHACTEIPREKAWIYELFAGERPIDEARGEVQALVYRTRAAHLPPALHLGWRPSGTMVHSPSPCPCGKP